MDAKQITSLVIAITIVANAIFALSGISAQVSCTVSQAAASAYAAFMPDKPK